MGWILLAVTLGQRPQGATARMGWDLVEPREGNEVAALAGHTQSGREARKVQATRPGFKNSSDSALLLGSPAAHNQVPVIKSSSSENSSCKVCEL
jgi:hypothetical protein